MFDFKTTFRLLCACAVCFGILWAIDNAGPGRGAMRRDRLLGFALRDVDQLMVERPDGRIVELRLQGENWRLVRPREVSANGEAVSMALDELERAPVLERIDNHDMELRELSLADFGLAPPRGRVVVRSPRTRVEMLCGDCDAATNGLFVKFEPGSDVYVTAPSLRSLLALSDRDFADRRLFSQDMRLVNAVVIRRPEAGDLKLVRSGRASWTITQPTEAPADWDAVADFFETLSGSTAIDFAGAGAPSSIDPATAATIRLFTQSDVAGRSVLVGGRVPGEADIAYAQGGDGAVVVVTGALRRAAMMTAYDFRSRRLFPSSSARPVSAVSVETPSASVSLRRSEGGAWALAAPIAAAAEPGEVAALIDAILSMSADRLAPAGLADAGSTSNRIATITMAYGDATVVLDAFRRDDDPSGRIAVLPKDSDTLFLVPPAAISNVTDKCGDPRGLVSRTVIDIDPDAVRAITVSRGGNATNDVEAAERLAGEWSSATPGRELDGPALLALLAAVHPLKAASVISAERDDETPLAEDGVVIAFDFADGPTLRRSIVLGPPENDGSRQACVTGSDILFSLAPDVAARLSGAILLPDMPAPQGGGAADPIIQVPTSGQ